MSVNNQKLIWDIPTRLFHWAIAIAICYSWYSIEISGNLDQHFLSGFTALGLIIFRIIWGFMGTRYARFSNFLYKPGEIVTYAKTFFRKEGGKYAGHNPMGGLSVFAILFFILIQTGTGMFADDEYYYFAPLNKFVSSSTAGTITEFHELNFNIILGLAILHIVTIIYYRFFKKEKLIMAMFTGRKTDEQGRYEAIPGSRLIAALILGLVIAGAVYGVVNYI